MLSCVIIRTFWIFWALCRKPLQLLIFSCRISLLRASLFFCVQDFIPNNGVSWLVSRVAIVAKFSKLFRTPAMFGRFTILARILGRPIVPPKKNWCKEKMYTFSGKNIACLPVPKESDSLLNPCSKNSFTTKFHALGHERVQFTNVSLPSGFTIAANFFRADPGAQEERKTCFNSN